MIDRSLRRDSGIGAADLFGDIGHEVRVSLDMQLVNERLVPGGARRAIIAPGERRVDHGSERGKGGVVARIECQVVRAGANLVAEQRVVPDEVAADPLGVRVEHHLVWVEAMPVGGLMRTMNAIAVQLAGQDVGEVAMPVLVAVVGLLNALSLFGRLGRVEEAKLHLARVLGKQRKVHPGPVPGRTQGVRPSRPDTHGRYLGGWLFARSAWARDSNAMSRYRKPAA